MNNPEETLVFITDEPNQLCTTMQVVTTPTTVEFSIGDYSGFRQIIFSPNQAIDLHAFLCKYYTHNSVIERLNELEKLVQELETERQRLANKH